MLRSRGWTITMNYFDESDIKDLADYIGRVNYDYYIFGFEGIHDASEVHPHIHFYIHFHNARTIRSIKKAFGKSHHIESVKDPSAMISYCKGYQGGKLKEPQCGENDWFEDGIPISNGVQTKSQEVVSAIQKGASLSKLYNEFPSYMIHHADKVAKYMVTLDKYVPPKFYVVDSIELAIKTFTDFVIISDFSDLQLYELKQLDTVIYSGYVLDSLFLYPYGMPITYNHGYIKKYLRCKNFVVVSGYTNSFIEKSYVHIECPTIGDDIRDDLEVIGEDTEDIGDDTNK